MFVKPAPDPANPDRQLLVRKPHAPRDYLKPDGEHVPAEDLDWHRLLLHGDIIEAEPPVDGAA